MVIVDLLLIAVVIASVVALLAYGGERSHWPLGALAAFMILVQPAAHALRALLAPRLDGAFGQYSYSYIALIATAVVIAVIVRLLRRTRPDE
ncbi:MAG: hypothetical protein JO019_03025 [Candidatus Kaiserbacteria bacterium]|nr:hypothetical protein [Candidatus Kaiserbacteria bacterium]